MNLQPRNKVDAAFSMASMTDLVFLLLIFFMLTSSFITPSGLPVSLPASKAGSIEVQKISVTITKDLNFYINERPVAKNDLERRLRNRLAVSEKEGVVALHVDKSVPTEELVYVAGIAASLQAKAYIVTQPQHDAPPPPTE